MKQSSLIHSAIILMGIAAVIAPAWSQPHMTPSASVATSAFARAGVRFTENRGQVVDTRGDRRPDILYTAGVGGMNLFFRRDGISYVFQHSTPDSSESLVDRLIPWRTYERPSGTLSTHRVDMQLIGANEHAEVIAESPTGSYSNYYLAQCPQGIEHVDSYGKITYREIYPRIDLVFHGNEDGLKYDFVVRPGGCVSDIRWRYVGDDGVTMTKEGGIEVASTLGTIGEDAPFAYQEGRGEVECRYRRSDGAFGFAARAYDRVRTLVIDPTVQWATYIGGSGLDAFGSYSPQQLTLGVKGGIALMGDTYSLDFPVTPGAMQRVLNGLTDLCITKLSSTGGLIWSTYWGGGAEENGGTICRDSAGGYAICGMSKSSDFPLAAPTFQPRNGGTYDMVIGTLDSAGMRRWATYLGGSQGDTPGGVACDQQGNLIVAGVTHSNNFPTLSPVQSTPGGASDCAIAKFTGAGALVWSTYYGGSGDDFAWDVTAGTTGEIAIAGYTASTDFPLAGTPFKSVKTQPGNDGFIARLTAAGTPLWATYYGGNGETFIRSVVMDAAGAVFVGGLTFSSDLPTTPSSFQPALGGRTDGLIAKFDPNGAHLWSTYYGGSNDDEIHNVRLAPNGEIFAAGASWSSDFPVPPNAFQTQLKGLSDATLVQMDPGGARMWATFFGGSTTEYMLGLAAGNGGVYISGQSYSNDFPVTAGAFQTTLRGVADMYIAKLIGFCSLAEVTVAPSGPVIICEGDSVALDAGIGFVDYRWAPGNEIAQRITVKRAGTYSVTVHDASGCLVTSPPVEVRVRKKPVPVIAPAGPISICTGDSIRLSARQAGFVKYTWSTGDTLDAIWVKATGTYSVRVVDTNGCEGVSASVKVTVEPGPARPELSSLDTITICADSVLRLDAGAGYASYRWSPNGERTRQISITRAGTYYVDVTNASGCAARSDTLVVASYPRSDVRLLVEGRAEFCAGDSVVLRVPVGLFIKPVWSRRDTIDAITIKSSGLYWVTVTDSNGCRRRSDSVRVIVHPALNGTITGPSTVCANTTPTYGASSVGTLRYEWSISGAGAIQGASDGKSITVQWGTSSGGTITLQITDTVTGCVVTGMRDVAIGGELKPVIAPAAITLCEGDSVELDAGAGYATYTWSNGARSQTIWVKDTLGYSVEVIDPTGCRGRSDTVHARIEKKPVVVIDGAVKVCRSTTVTYSARDNTGASYQWAVSGGSVTAGDGTASVTVQWGTGSNGVITLRMTSAAGCTGEVTMNVEIGSQLKPTIAASAPLNLCAPDSVELDAGSGYASYLWSPGGETSQKIMASTAGSYSVTVQDASGCGGTSDPVQVTINPSPSVTITPSGPLKLKPKESITLDAGPGYASYRWSTGATTRQIVGIDTGSYSVTVTDGNGCTATATVHVDLDDTRSGGRAELTLGSVSASPGERVEVPLLLVSSDSLGAAGASGYTARIRYRASLLEPVDATPRGTIDNDDRVISLSGDLPAGMTSGELARIAFMAALGDSEAIAVKLEEVLWRDVSGSPLSIATMLHDGSFTLVGLCTNGGVRLVSTGGAVALRIVGSNPVHDLLDVEYELIEAGHHDLILYDILGREAGRLLSADLLPGSGTARREARDLPDGLYLLVLRTPTARLSLPVRVVR